MNLSWRKAHKYYNIYLQANLLGGYTVVRSWGRIGSKRVGGDTILCDSMEDAENIIKKTIKRRIYRGYVPND